MSPCSFQRARLPVRFHFCFFVIPSVSRAHRFGFHACFLVRASGGIHGPRPSSLVGFLDSGRSGPPIFGTCEQGWPSSNFGAHFGAFLFYFWSKGLRLVSCRSPPPQQKVSDAPQLHISESFGGSLHGDIFRPGGNFFPWLAPVFACPEQRDSDNHDIHTCCIYIYIYLYIYICMHRYTIVMS